MADDTETMDDTEVVPLPRARPAPEVSTVDEDSAYLRALQRRDPSLTADAPPSDTAAATPAVPPSDDKFISDLTGIRRGYNSVVDENTKRFDNLVRQDRERMQRQFERQQFAAEALPAPWQPDKERAERIRGPFENFGSLATVFGMFASAATRAPLTSALNAGASAMEAIRNSDEKAYESAYKAWKDNTNLALKQFEIENKLFDDSLTLMNTDLATWRATSMANEASFNNKKALLFLENGMDKEYLQAKEAQAKAALQMQKSAWEGELFDTRHRIFKISVAEFKKQHPDALPSDEVMFKLNLIRGLNSEKGIYGFAEQQVADGVRQYMMQHGVEPPAEVKNKMIADALAGRYAARPGASTPIKDYLAARVPELMKPKEEGGMGLSETEARLQAEREHATARAKDPVVTEGRINAAEIQRRAAEYEKQGLSKTDAFDKARKELVASSPTGVKMEEKRVEKQTQLTSIISQIDRAQTLIKESQGQVLNPTGMKGVVSRFKDWLTGADEGAREFRQIVKTLQLQVPSLMRGSSKVLASEKAEIDAIVPGLDYFQNEKQAYNGLDTLKRILQKADLVDEQAVIDVATPDEANALPKGTRYRAPDGKEYIR